MIQPDIKVLKALKEAGLDLNRDVRWLMDYAGLDETEDLKRIDRIQELAMTIRNLADNL